MDILDFIPKGEMNSVSRRDLMQFTGKTDREIRRLIAQARREVPILNFGNGYFIPTERERGKAKVWYKKEAARARSIFWSAKAAKEFGGMDALEERTGEDKNEDTKEA